MFSDSVEIKVYIIILFSPSVISLAIGSVMYDVIT